MNEQLKRALQMFFMADGGADSAGADGADGADGKDGTATPDTDTTDYKALYEKQLDLYNRAKKSLDDTSSKYAALKKEQNARLTDDEKHAADLQDKEEQLAAANKRLNVIETQNKFAKSGYDEKDYSDLTEQLVDACGEKAAEIADLLVKFTSSASAKAVALAKNSSIKENTVNPNGGNNDKAASKDMDFAKRIAAQNKPNQSLQDITKQFAIN